MCRGRSIFLGGVACPGKSSAALGQLLGREAVERGNCGIPKNLEALVHGNGSDVGDATQLDEGCVCSGHVVKNGNQAAELELKAKILDQEVSGR